MWRYVTKYFHGGRLIPEFSIIRFHGSEDNFGDSSLQFCGIVYVSTSISQWVEKGGGGGAAAEEEVEPVVQLSKGRNWATQLVPL